MGGSGLLEEGSENVLDKTASSLEGHRDFFPFI